MKKKEFGEFFKNIRLESGYSSQRKLAEATNGAISHGTIAKLENGSQLPKPETLEILSMHLKNITYEELLQKSGYIQGPKVDINSLIEHLPNDEEIFYFEQIEDEIQEKRQNYTINQLIKMINDGNDDTQTIPSKTNCFYNGKNLFTTINKMTAKELRFLISKKFPKYPDLENCLLIYNKEFNEVIIFTDKLTSVDVIMSISELKIFIEMMKYSNMMDSLKKQPEIEIKNIYEIWSCIKKITGNSIIEFDC